MNGGGAESRLPSLEVDARDVIRAGLTEDLGPSGDVTSQALVPEGAVGRAHLLAREPLVVCGVSVAAAVFRHLDPEVVFVPRARDGDHCGGERHVLAEVSGDLRALLAGERLALNLLQRLSGIATFTARFVAEVQGTHVRLVDTRKTTPGLRTLEKYAVRVGGAHNHRMGLFDGVLIKDNHLAVCGSVAEAVRRARARCHPLLRVQVEVESLRQLEEAAAAGADAALLDNMGIPEIRACVTWAREKAPGLLLEASGGVRLDNVRAIAETGVHQVSAGALVHQARWVDVSMDLQAGGAVAP